MAVMILDPKLAEKVLADREAAAGERPREEVWEGVTVIMPEADNPHDTIAGFFFGVFWNVFGLSDRAALHFRVNISDRDEDWKSNYRVPDLSLFLVGTAARDRGTYWVGGPDFALEVVSPGDRSRDKLGFYASIGTREVLILDRDPWRMELYELSAGQLRLTATTVPGGEAITSAVVPFRFQFIRAEPAPRIRIVDSATGQEWVK